LRRRRPNVEFETAAAAGRRRGPVRRIYFEAALVGRRKARNVGAALLLLAGSWLWSAERRASQQAALVSVRVGESLQNIERDALHKDGQRRQTLLAALDQEDLAALVCFTPENVRLVSGYWPVMAASMAWLTRDGALHIVVPEDELHLAEASADGAHFLPYKPETLDSISTPAEALEKTIARVAEWLSLRGGRLGVLLGESEQTQSYLSGSHFHCALVPMLQRSFPDVSLVGADALLPRMNSVKTEQELERMRHLCRLAKTGFDAARQAIAHGRREDEIAADIQHAYGPVAQEGFERGDGYFFCMSGPNSTTAAAAFARTRQRVVESGDLMIHANTVGDGFWSDMTRTFTAGEPDDLEQRMRRAIGEARSAALAVIRPGAQASAIDAAAREVLAGHGFGKEFRHAVGHGVGFAAADPRALPRLHPKSPDVIETGMTFNIEPAIYIEGRGGMRNCDVVVCTSSGAEVLTDF
jgi:Xaa-Pro aminopeptidase